MSLLSEEEYTRVHSHVEFLIFPDLLALHCKRLQTGEEKFPTGGDLIRTFLKEGSEQDAKEKGSSTKGRALYNLASQVVSHLQYELEDLETIVPVKYQRHLLVVLIENPISRYREAITGNERASSSSSPLLPSPSPVVWAWLLKHRWVVRFATNQLPIKLKSLIKLDSMIPGVAEVREALDYLSLWLADSNATILSPDMEFKISFELGEYCFLVREYKEALNFFTRANQLLKQNPSLAAPKTSPTTHMDVHLASNSNLQALQQGHVHNKSGERLDERLEGFFTVLTLFLESDPLPASPSLQLETLIENINKKVNLSENQAVLDALYQDVLDLLEKDILLQNLFWNHRLSLQSLPNLHPIQEKVSILNLIWRLVNTDTTPSLTWIFCLSFENSFKFFLNCLSKTWKSMGSPMNVVSRFSRLWHIIFTDMNSIEGWKEACEVVPNFVLASDLKMVLNLESQLLVQQKLHNILRIGPKEMNSHHLEILLYSWKAEEVLEAAKSVLEQFSPSNAPVNFSSFLESIMFKRISDFEASKSFDKALSFYQVLLDFKTSSDSFLLWGHFIASVQTFTGSDIDIFIQEQSEKLFGLGILPTVTHLEILAAFLIDSEKFDLLTTISRKVTSLFSNNTANISSFHGPLIVLSKMITGVSRLLQVALRLIAGAQNENYSSAYTECPSILEEVLQVLIKERSSSYLFEWSSKGGLLSQIQNEKELSILATFGLLALQQLYKTAKISTEIKFDSLNAAFVQVSSTDNFYWLQACRSINLSNEAGIFDFALQSLQQCLKINSQSRKEAFMLGELNFHKQRYSSALRYYLLSASTETGLWTHDHSQSYISVLPKVIHCLIDLKAYDQAIVVYQYTRVIDYAAVFKLVAQFGHFFTEHFFQFLWDIPIMESLVHALKVHGDMKRVTALITCIGKPELNIFNDLTRRAKNTRDWLKRSFLDTLCKQYLANGTWQGDS